MSSSESSPLVQDVAARLASQLGLPQPNSLLASRVISIATSTPTEAAFIKAAKGFGRFSDDFLADIRDKIRSEKGDNANGAPASLGIVSRADVDRGIKITEGERLAPEKPIRAGLNVMDNAEVSATTIFQIGPQAHTDFFLSSSRSTSSVVQTAQAHAPRFSG
jgi:hypothetical protein